MPCPLKQASGDIVSCGVVVYKILVLVALAGNVSNTCEISKLVNLRGMALVLIGGKEDRSATCHRSVSKE